MYRRFSDFVLRWARVRPEPEPPLGAPGSERTFRAGKNYYYLRLLGWGATQIGAAAGLTFSIGFVASLDSAVQAMVLLRTRTATTASPTPEARASSPEGSPIASPEAVGSASPSASPHPSPTPASSDLSGVRDFNDAREMLLALESPSPAAGIAPAEPAATEEAPPTRSRRSRTRRNIDGLAQAVQRMPYFVYWSFTTWVLPVVFFLEALGITAFLVLIPATYALARIEYEQHWYIVTDRSLRIRTGVLSLSESTMSFANLQQVEVKQGPVQRLLGLADVRVQSAGGGSSDEHGGDALHTGVFRSVENAHEIRDLIVARLRTFREAGLGDAERTHEAERSSSNGPPPEALAAAHEVLREARALRTAISTGV